ncbi:hypothetical protein GCM10027059_02860 [Myceligenerans halotolerans]
MFIALGNTGRASQVGRAGSYGGGRASAPSRGAVDYEKEQIMRGVVMYTARDVRVADTAQGSGRTGRGSPSESPC